MMICCAGCGRELGVDARSYAKHPHRDRYCFRCTLPGKTHQISEQKDRTTIRSPEWFGAQPHEDDYSDLTYEG